MIPSGTIDHRLDVFAEECKEFDFIFGTFSEVVTGQRQNYKINTISSSSLSVYLDALPEVTALIAITVERMLAFYKQLLEIRKLRSDLTSQGVPKDALKGIDSHANEKMEASIKIIVKEVMDKYGKQHDAGRRNELDNAIHIALKKLANRIDKGYHIEVRVGQLPESNENQDEDSQKLLEIITAINGAAKALEYIRPEGDSVLTLHDNSPIRKKAPRKTGKGKRGAARNPKESTKDG